MRIFRNCSEAASELKREVKEMGVEVRLKTMQDKNVADDPDYYTKELLCYSYMIHEPKDKEELLKAFGKETAWNQIWCQQEFEERISGNKWNPGQAWKYRKEIWEPLLEDSGQFSYTYGERIGDQVQKVTDMLLDNPNSRNAIVSIWDRQLDQDRTGGKRRVPCSLQYQFLIRNEKLNLIYYIRSNDIMTHWCFDVWQAIRLQEYLAERLGFPIGNFYQFIGSLHGYMKDLHGIF